MELSTYLAGLSFNGAVVRVFGSDGVGGHTMAAARKKDEERVTVSKYENRPEEKKRRVVLRKQRRNRVKRQQGKALLMGQVSFNFVWAFFL